MARMVFENNAWHLSDNWDIDDVRSVIENRRNPEDFTDEECVRALMIVADAFDANVGVNWEVIDAAVDMVIKEKQGEMK